IRPVLADVELASLSDDEILFTAVKSRVPAVYVGYLAIAQRLAATTRLPADVLYALFRAGLPTQLPALLLQPAARIRTALAAAVAAGTAPASVTANVDATLATMRSLIASHVLATTDADGFTLAPILAASGATAAQQSAFVARYVDHEGDDNAFWDAARADTTIGPVADSLAFAIGAGILSRDNVALVKTLVARRSNAIHELVGLAAADWEKLIRESGGTVPDEITDDTADARIAAYAADLVETLRAAFPSLAAGLHVAAGTAIASAGRTDLGMFFANAPEFAFEDTRVRDYLAAHRTTALAGVVDEATLTANLERVRRQDRVAPRGEHVDAVLAAGLDSAHAIAAMSPANFVADHAGSLGGTEMAMMAYQKSAQVSAAAKVIGTGYYQWARGGAIEQPPDLETLFGPIDSCECDQCQSVYGAASYLVDVLQFLRTSSTTPFTVLMQRRPDLQYLQLTCDNTLTPLPLIDLANEILEYYVGHPDFKALTDAQARELAKNTTSDITVAQLSLTPQYSYLDAYETLRTALRSPKLPFDRWLETIRAYLALLGTSRYEILDALLPVAPAADLARATLNLSVEQWNILIGTSPATTVGELYGFPANTADATWRNQLCVVDKLLARADIAYAELVALVNTLFVNPTLRTSTVGPTTVVLFSEDDSCDLAKTYLQFQATVHAQNATTGLQAADWRRIAQFLRLWRTVGWSIPDVDRALTALGVTTLTEPALIELAQLEQLRADLDITVAQLVSLWAPLDTFGAFSLYAQLFQNRALLNPPDAAFDLAASGVELQTTGQPLEAHKAAVLAGLRLGATDLDLLVSTLGITTLSLVNLSALYRHVVLARALDLSVADLLALVAFTASEVDPFAAGAPALTRRFVGIARAIAETDLSVAQLAYAFQAKDPTATIAPLSDTITALLAELQDALRKIVDDNQVQPDASGALLRAKLGMALDATLVDRAMAVIDGKPTPDAPDFVVSNFTFCSAATQANLVDVAFGNVEIRRALVLGELLAFLRASRSRGAINQALADALAIDSKVVSYMLETAPALSSDVTAPRMADFLALVGDGLVGTYYDVADFDTTTVAAIPARTDAELDFYWGSGSPDPALPTTGFGVRWKGFVVPQHDETYTFYVRAGDGARVWITSDLAVADPTTGVPLIDHWTDASEASSTVAMTGGQAYQIVVDYHLANPGADPDHPGAALVFSWSSLSTPKATVPQSSLYTRPYVAPATLAPAYLRLHRVAVLAAGLGLDAVELAYVNEHRGDFAGFDATLLGTIAAPWPQWDALRAYVALRDRMPTADLTLLDVFAAGSVAMLARLAGWDAAQATTLASQLGLQDAELRNASGPTRMRDTFLLAQRVGVSIDELVSWATTPTDHAQADDVIRAAKARYDDASWATAAKPITDILRNQRRDALVAYALSDPAMATRNVIDENSLFEYFLLDVNMDACMQTSRLKQAISSAQLWVQRCLMNLEPAVSPSLLDADRWSWMKHYRVWEANRKVFLYPENWMDPTLRDDKTPFFAELEAQLLQGPLTIENLEAAVGDYLRKLDTVARLELCAVYRQAAVAGEDDGDLVHVIGRTANAPRAYYYRQFATTSETWTPWQAIPLDIDGDHVIPCVWERRLYLFWTSFEQKPDAGQDLSGPSMDTDAHQAWEVASAAYEEYKKGLKLYNDTTTELEEIVTGGVDQDPANNPPGDPNPGDWFRDLLEQMYGTLGGIGNTNGEVVEQGRFPSPGDPGPEPAKSDDSASEPRKHWEIKLAWAEYADGAWGTKQSCDTPLESYQHGSYKPTSEDHFFRVATGTGLAVYCYRRHQAVFDLPYSDAGFRIGHFALDDCHGRMRVIQHDAEGNAPGQTTFPTPAGSRLSFMGYGELPKTSELIFTGPAPAFHERELLKATPRIYDVVPPCEPGTSSDGEVAYPFVFQDTRRVYLASPVRLPVPSRAKGPSRPPLDLHYVAAQDPTLTKIQGINTGDPGPEQAGSPV
ncbi:MAG: neuraminidase-like domain-containing protein, partial [Kofleriaceae bacterium]